MNINNPKGFSLVEVVVAGIIFTITIAGIFASLATIKNHPSLIKDDAVGAALCGQRFLESLRPAVDQRDWNSGLLQVRGPTAAPDCIENGKTYHLSYQVVNDGSARKGTVTVTW